MENTLLVGLSRQVALERQLGVVANNIANVNTTGYKSDTAIFEEYLKSGAHDDDFNGNDTRLSFVVDRATVHDFGQGPVERTGNPLDLDLYRRAAFAPDISRNFGTCPIFSFLAVDGHYPVAVT